MGIDSFYQSLKEADKASVSGSVLIETTDHDVVRPDSESVHKYAEYYRSKPLNAAPESTFRFVAQNGTDNCRVVYLDINAIISVSFISKK